MRHALFLAASLVALAGAASAEAPFAFDTTPGKLPKTVRPSAYRIQVAMDVDKLTLKGRESIDVEVRRPTATMVLNQAGLQIQSAKLETGAEAKVTLNEAEQTATLTFPRAVAAGRHTLSIAYTGPIPESPNGIYYDDYRSQDGAKKRMLVTQFEVADARRMFPGWDEPAFKATFQLDVTVPSAYAAVSNMPIARTSSAGAGEKTVSFAVTPPMSSYLLAFVAGDMKAVSGQAAGVKMNAWAPSGREEEGRYALEAEQKILPFYNDYFGEPYPLPKLDMLAIPGNYEAGAMENWGAITYIDNALLFDPKTSSPATREEIFLVVAHEMAHQWSGDLVTMGWWDNIWLNEGFATWMETKANDHFNPEWQVWPRQHLDRETAMGSDARAGVTHPIQQPIHNESEANAAFDRISYQKGGQVIRMIEDWIGPDVFRAGMRRYMRAHKYSNATSADLWAALSAASGKDVAAVAKGFTEQAGVPLVKVELNESRTCTAGSITLSQDRFAIDDPTAKPETWTIPVTIGDGAAPQRVLLGAQPMRVPMNTCGPIKVNLGENGYYRTQYSAPLLAKLGADLERLEPADRANLLGDQYALFLGERASLADYFALVDQLKGETHIAVWTDTLNHLHSVHWYLTDAAEQKPFDAYAIARIKPAFERLGWTPKPGESFLDSLLRPQFIAALGEMGDAATIAEARTRFQAFLGDPAALPPSIRGPVLEIVGHNADRATWERLRDLGVKSTSTEEKLRYFAAMAQAQDLALIEANIAFANSGEVPNGRIPQFLNEISTGSGKADQVYDLVVPHEAELAKRLPADGLSGGPLPPVAAGSLSPAVADKLLAAPSSNTPSGKIAAQRIAASIRTSAHLRRRFVPAVRDWLAARK